MRCYCCNESLTTIESKIRWKDTLEFADTCLGCLQTIDRDYFVPRGIDDEELRDDYEVESLDDLLDMHEDEYWDER